MPGVGPLRVRDFMTTALLTVAPGTDIMRAVRLLVDQDVSGLLVVDDARRLVGILTERDCIDVALQAGYFDEGGGTVAQYMSTDLYTVSPETSLMDVAELFARSRFRRCPVVAEGRLVGLIGRRDVLRALSSGAWFSDPGTGGTAATGPARSGGARGAESQSKE